MSEIIKHIPEESTESLAARHFGELTNDVANSLQVLEGHAASIRDIAATSARLGNEVGRGEVETMATIEELHQIIDGMQADQNTLLQESAQIQQDSKVIDAENKLIRTGIRELWNEIEKTISETDGLYGRREILSAEIDRLEQAIGSHRRVKRDVRIQLEKARQALREEYARYPEQPSEMAEEQDPAINALQAKWTEESRHENETEAALARKEIDEERLEGQINQKLGLLREYQQQLAAFNVRIAENLNLQQVLERDNDGIAQKLSNLQNRTNALRAMIRSLSVNSAAGEGSSQNSEAVLPDQRTEDAEVSEQQPIIPVSVTYREDSGAEVREAAAIRLPANHDSTRIVLERLGVVRG